jgi:hypothetical protein
MPIRVRKRISGGKGKSYYILIPQSWIHQLEMGLGYKPQHVDLEIDPLTITVRPVLEAVNVEDVEP